LGHCQKRHSKIKETNFRIIGKILGFYKKENSATSDMPIRYMKFRTPLKKSLKKEKVGQNLNYEYEKK